MQLSTKQDFRQLMLRILEPLKPLYSPGGARLRIGHTGATYGKNAIELEAFSRPLWALAPFWMGGGRAPELEELYRRGLVSGTDPQNPEYWGDPGDYDQCFVEMAAIACAILEVPRIVWDPLTERQKQNLAAWLNTINQHKIPECNWQFFMILVNLALDSVGMPCDMDNAERGLDKVESYYKGDGWYTDGASPQKDYYIPWAMQYYGVLYSAFMAERDPARAKRFADRAVEFGRQFALWFDQNGAALPFGRSLTYRFGQCAFYAACLFAGIEPLPVPVMKGILVRNLQWWMEKPIFDRDGVLTIGYCYPQMYMAERYNAPGSPYWGLKTFLLLALPDDHPFWTAEAAPLPALPALKALPHADMLMQRLPDGQVNAYAAGVCELYGHGQFPEKYSKFVYSTRFGFSASRSSTVLHQAAPDSMLAFVIDDYVFVRRASKTSAVLADRVVSTWSPFAGIEVETEIIPCDGGHIRRHTVTSSFACQAYDCGFAVAKFAPGFAQRIEQDETAGAARAENAAQGCVVTGAGRAEIIQTDPNTSLYDPNTVIPAVCYEIPAGRTVTLETRVTAFVNEGAGPQ